MILDGNVVAEKTQVEIRDGVARLRERYGVAPALAVLLLGADPASALYVRSKKRMAAAVGIESPDHVYPEGLGREALLALIDRLNADHGIHPVNLGRLLAGSPTVLPCTPSGCMALLDHYGAKLEGAEAVVIGRSRI